MRPHLCRVGAYRESKGGEQLSNGNVQHYNYIIDKVIINTFNKRKRDYFNIVEINSAGPLSVQVVEAPTCKELTIECLSHLLRSLLELTLIVAMLLAGSGQESTGDSSDEHGCSRSAPTARPLGTDIVPEPDRYEHRHTHELVMFNGLCPRRAHHYAYRFALAYVTVRPVCIMIQISQHVPR